MNAKSAKIELHKFSDEERAKNLRWFFKTGPGEYGAGDIFIGIKVPEIRSVAKKFWQMPLKEALKLLKSKIHEERLLALLILKEKFIKGDPGLKLLVHKTYLQSIKHINNWDLVDLSAPTIVGEFLAGRNKNLLLEMASAKNLWKRRIAIISTFALIKNKIFSDSLKIAEKLLGDEEDLIHKAVGWMLREIGNRDSKAEEDFLKVHYRKMPRTMLRYAIEKFPERKRQAYLKGLI